MNVIARNSPGEWLHNGLCDLVERKGRLERMPYEPYVAQLRHWQKESNRVTELDADPFSDPVDLQHVIDAARRIRPAPDSDWH